MKNNNLGTEKISRSPCSTNNLSAQLQSHRLPGLNPLILLIKRPHNHNLAHPNRLRHTGPSARTNQSNPARIHEHSLARFANQLHLTQHRQILSILELSPYTFLSTADKRKCHWVWRDNGPPSQRSKKAVTKEDREYSEVLSGMWNGYSGQSCTECVLDAGAEVVGERHAEKNVTCLVITMSCLFLRQLLFRRLHTSPKTFHENPLVLAFRACLVTVLTHPSSRASRHPPTDHLPQFHAAMPHPFSNARSHTSSMSLL